MDGPARDAILTTMSGELDMALLDAAKEQVKAERELGDRLHEYVGRWVALDGQTIVADADSLEDLLSIIDVDDVERVLKVEETAGISCFY
jgi:hypothetical protein